MRTPYTKLFLTEWLAFRRRIPADRLCLLLDAVADYATFGGDFVFDPLDDAERNFMTALKSGVDDAEKAYRTKVENGRKGGLKRSVKQSLNQPDKQPLNRSLGTQNTEHRTQNTKPVSDKSDTLVEVAFFNDFWSIYPKDRKAEKAACQRKFIALVTAGTSAVDIIEGARRYAASDEVARGFAKAPLPWLRAERWVLDYATPPAVNKTLQTPKVIL